jgi:hypothetical protein
VTGTCGFDALRGAVVGVAILTWRLLAESSGPASA